jgi:hypothetical protein
MRTKNIYAKDQQRKCSKAFAGIGILLLALSLVGCGTTSDFKAAGKSAVDFSQFNRVVVKDFTDGVSDKLKGPVQEAKRFVMKQVTKDFGEMVAWEIGQTAAFHEVLRGGAEDGKTLIVGGQITRFEEGNPEARFWVGMGAGSSYFDARVEFFQGGSGELLGTIDANHYSWVLGGAIAASQTPDIFMRDAAKKVADEIGRRKAGPRSTPIASHN